MRTKALFIALAIAGSCFGKDVKTVVLTTNPQMHCTNCEKKIKENIRFEKGIKSIKTNLDDKTVTIEYDADKTNVQNIINGIGYGIAKHLGLSGWQVVIGARDEQRAEKAISELKAQGIDVLGWVNIELKDLDGIEKAAKEINEKYPELTLLVNNAGIPGDMSVDSEHTEISVIRETLDVNFVGTFALTKALIPLIAKNSGRIANVTVPSEISLYWHPLAYVASKAAQNAMMGVMAIEFQQSNTPVEIFSVHPGPTTTDLNGNMALPGFHDIETVGQKFAELINDGENHQGEFIELYPIVKED